MIKCIIYGIVVFIGLVALWRIQRTQNESVRKKLQLLVLICYGMGVLYFTLLSREPDSSSIISIQPFHFFRTVLTFDTGALHVIKEMGRQLIDGRLQIGLVYAIRSIHVKSTEPLVGVILNILLFMPLGYILPLMIRSYKNRFRKAILISFLVSLSIETIQLVGHLGWFDVDDLINNTIGAALGTLLFNVFLKSRMQGDGTKGENKC